MRITSNRHDEPILRKAPKLEEIKEDGSVDKKKYMIRSSHLIY